MTTNVFPSVRNKFPDGFFDKLFALPDSLGYEIYHQILLTKGGHITDIGNSRGGKTEKKKWLLLQLSRVGETIIEFDTGKEGDIECYFWNDNPEFRFNKPVTVLVPYEGGCKFEVTGVPEEIRVQVLPVPSPELMLDMIQPGEINIVSLRNYFDDPKELKKYFRRIFQNAALRARRGEFKRWSPACISIDEAHEVTGGQRGSLDGESVALTLELGNMERQLASSKIRLFFTTQELEDLSKPIRKNTHIFIVNRGDYSTCENKKIRWLSGFASRAFPNQGWFVIHGEHYYKNFPVDFPYIGSPECVTVTRSGAADAPFMDDGDEELLLDGGYLAVSHYPHDPIVRVGSPFADLPEIPQDTGPGPVEFVNVWEQKEESKKSEGVKNES
jgi:hypothetical protein